MKTLMVALSGNELIVCIAVLEWLVAPCNTLRSLVAYLGATDCGSLFLISDSALLKCRSIGIHADISENGDYCGGRWRSEEGNCGECNWVMSGLIDGEV